MADFTELGSSGLKRAGGFVHEEFLPALQGLKGVKVYREMADNDPVIGPMLLAFEKVITRLDYRVDPADPDDTTAAEYAEFIDGCLHDMSESWDATLGNILTMLPFGWQYSEILYKRRVGPDEKDPTRRSKYTDSKIGWRKFAPRAQETLFRWDFDDDGGIQAMVQMDPYGDNAVGEVAIPIDKALLFRTTTKGGNPEGRSMLRNAYRPWYFKKRIEEIEAIGIERDLAGLPVAYIPADYLAPDATTTQQQIRQQVVDIVQGIKRNEQEGVVFPMIYDEKGHKMFDLALLSTGGQRQFDTDAIVARYDQRISMTMLADFLLLGHEKVGSFALGSSKIDLWTMVVDAVAGSICEVINKHAIPRLMKLNGLDTRLAPTLAYGDVSHVELAELAEFVDKMVSSGAIVPDPTLEEHLRETADLPPAEERVETTERTSTPAGPEVSAAVEADEEEPDGENPDGQVDEDPAALGAA